MTLTTSLICKFTLMPTTHQAVLISDSYEDDDPAPAAKEEPVQPEPVAEESEPLPKEEFKGEDTDDFNIQTEADHDFEDSYSAPQPPSERPIGMKDDGYV